MVLSFSVQKEKYGWKAGVNRSRRFAVKKRWIFSGGLCEPASVGDFELSRVLSGLG
jgi:hypothetical protein